MPPPLPEKKPFHHVPEPANPEPITPRTAMSRSRSDAAENRPAPSAPDPARAARARSAALCAAALALLPCLPSCQAPNSQNAPATPAKARSVQSVKFTSPTDKGIGYEFTADAVTITVKRGGKLVFTATGRNYEEAHKKLNAAGYKPVEPESVNRVLHRVQQSIIES